MLLHASCLNPGVLSLLPRSRNQWEPLPKIKPCASLGTHHFRRLCAASSSPLLHHGKQGSLFQSIPKLPQRRQRPLVPRASKDVADSYRYPPMTEKPKWWWRILACLPYLIPLHNIVDMYDETAYNLHPFLEDFEFLTYPFLEALGRLPIWFLVARFFIASLVIPRKELPHFFRFHVVMGILLEMVLQVIKTVNPWIPRAIYWGKLGMHFWTALDFALLFTVLECMMCALTGMYADVPFVSDAAYIQSD